MADVRAAQGKARRDALLSAVRAGQTVRDALDALGWSRPAYEKMRERHRAWAQAVTAAQARAVETADLPPETFQGFTGRYFPDRRAHFAHQLLLVRELERLEPRDIVLFLLWPEAGKGLWVETPILTSHGPRPIGELEVGDVVFAGDGTPTRVTATSEVHHRDCYALTFSGGGKMIADDEHQWLVRSSTPRSVHVADTETLARIPSVERGETRPNHAVPVVRPLEFPPRILPLDPYLLGVWLGDGATDGGRITSIDSEVEEAFVSAGWEISSRYELTFYVAGLRQTLRKVGVLGDKHIPAEYLMASVEQRWALLEGLMDSDGSCDTQGRCEFTTTSDRLAGGFASLLRLLGMKFSLSEGRAILKGRDCGPKWRFSFVARRVVFRLDRKATRQRIDIPNDRASWRTIRTIQRVPTVATRCIAVEHPSRTYVALADDGTPIVTHNSATLEDYICRELARDPDHRFRVISQTPDHAKRMVGFVKNRLTDASQFGAFIAQFGPFYEKGQERSGKPWTTTEISLLHKSGAERDYNLVASSWSSATYGARIDTLIIDDVCSKENYNDSEKIVDQLRATFFNRGAGMRTIIIGTRVGPRDTYELLDEVGIITRTVIVPVLGAMGAEIGEPSVPEWAEWQVASHQIRHTNGACCKGFRPCPNNRELLSAAEYLALLRHQAGEKVWWSAYMQNPVADELSTFGEYLERCKDLDRPVGYVRRDEMVVPA